MKKVMLLACAVALLATTACSKSTPSASEPQESVAPTTESNENRIVESEIEADSAEVSAVQVIADSIKDQMVLEEGMAPIQSDRNAENAYPGITELANEYAIYTNATGAFVDEIAVLHLANGASLEELEDLLIKRVELQREKFVDYRPDEMPKLDDPTIVTNTERGIVILVISGDSPNAQIAVENALSK